MQMCQLIYSSQPFGFDSASLFGILADARRCNARDGITGMLICRADLYLQLLEGPRDKVTDTFARIMRDDRHAGIMLLSCIDVQTRLFPDWAMKDDPARTWLWTKSEIEGGALQKAAMADVQQVFARAAREIA